MSEKVPWKPTSPASKTMCPSVPPQDNGQTDNCGSGEKARAATTILSQSHPTVARGCSCTSLLGVLQQSWPVATMLAALPCFQMLALIKRSLKSTSWWRRDIWKVNCCYSCRDQHGAERSPSDLSGLWHTSGKLGPPAPWTLWAFTAGIWCCMQGKHLLQAGSCSSSAFLMQVFSSLYLLSSDALGWVSIDFRGSTLNACDNPPSILVCVCVYFCSMSCIYI